jgi:hypothetical protein
MFQFHDRKAARKLLLLLGNFSWQNTARNLLL